MPNDDSSTSVVSRLAAVLNAFRDRDVYLGVNEIARRTELPKSTVSRLVKEMHEAGFLERKAQKVGLGLQMFEWGELASRRRSLRQVALPFMADLREATRQTIHLALLDGTEVVYVEILHREDAPRLPSRVGGRLPAHATGVGKALLSASDPEVIDRAIAAGLVAVGPRTIRQSRRPEAAAPAGGSQRYRVRTRGIRRRGRMCRERRARLRKRSCRCDFGVGMGRQGRPPAGRACGPHRRPECVACSGESKCT